MDIDMGSRDLMVREAGLNQMRVYPSAQFCAEWSNLDLQFLSELWSG